jgi:hypothetical protein
MLIDQNFLGCDKTFGVVIKPGEFTSYFGTGEKKGPALFM